MTTEMTMHATNIKQTYGPRIQFRGEILAEAEFEPRSGPALWVRFCIWRTEGQALVAEIQKEYAEREGLEVEAAIIEPQENQQAMHFAVLEFFGWQSRAKSMAKELGWSMTRKVD